MPPTVCFERAETLDGGLKWSLFLPRIHPRLLQVAMILLIDADADAARSPIMTVTGSREAADQCASTADALQGGRVFRDLTMAAASCSGRHVLNTRSATISIYTSTAAVLGCCARECSRKCRRCWGWGRAQSAVRHRKLSDSPASAFSIAVRQMTGPAWKSKMSARVSLMLAPAGSPAACSAH